MTEKTTGKATSGPPTKLVVFGVDGECRPHAAWFSNENADAARTIAKQLRLNVIETVNGKAADLVAKLPAGRIHANGPGAVPPVREDLYEKLVATLNSRGEAGKQPHEPTLTDLPSSWEGIKPGHLVLANDTLTEGWWAAIVVGRSSDKLTLRWRDYPGHPNFTVPATAVALVGPAAA